MKFSFATVARVTAIALGVLGMVMTDHAVVGTIEVFHADSRELKKAFEAKTPGVTINFTPGTSRQLAERILKGENCDVFAPSSDQVMDEDMLGKKIIGEGAPRDGSASPIS